MDIIEDYIQEKYDIKIIGLGDAGLNFINYLSTKKKDDTFTDLFVFDKERNYFTSSKEQSNIEFNKNDIVFVVTDIDDQKTIEAANEISERAKIKGALTFSLVVEPFPFAGKKRSENYTANLNKIALTSDSTIAFTKNRISIAATGTLLVDIFEAMNIEIFRVIKSIYELLLCPGMITVDINDVNLVVSEKGIGTFGYGEAFGKMRAKNATKKSIQNLASDNEELSNYDGLMVNITAGINLSLGEFSEVGTIIEKYANKNATVIIGTVIDPKMNDQIRVTIIATGKSNKKEKLVASSNIEYSSIKIITPEGTSDVKLAELILDITNVYKSVGGDEFIISDINKFPPTEIFSSSKHQKKVG